MPSLHIWPSNVSQNHWKSVFHHLDDVIKWKLFPRNWPFVRKHFLVTGEFPTQRPVTRSFAVFFDLRLYQQLSKQWRRWWFETPSRSLWRHCNETGTVSTASLGYNDINKIDQHTFVLPYIISTKTNVAIRPKVSAAGEVIVTHVTLRWLIAVKPSTIRYPDVRSSEMHLPTDQLRNKIWSSHKRIPSKQN